MTTTLIERIRDRHKSRIKDADLVGAFAAPGGVSIGTKDPRCITIIATTSDIDLDNEVVVPEGANIEYFATNRNVFLDHDTSWQNGVALFRTMSPMMKGGTQVGWKVNATVRHGETGDHVLKMIEEGGVGSSIGFIPTNHGKPTDVECKRYTTKDGKEPEYIHREWDWLESTLTLFACNLPCRVSLAGPQIDEKKAVVVERLLTQGKISKHSASLVGFPVRKGAIISVRLPKRAA